MRGSVSRNYSGMRQRHRSGKPLSSGRQLPVLPALNAHLPTLSLYILSLCEDKCKGMIELKGKTLAFSGIREFGNNRKPNSCSNKNSYPVRV